MGQKTTFGFKFMLILSGVLVGVFITIFVCIVSPFLIFMPYGVKVALVETRKYSHNNDEFIIEDGYVQDSDTAIKIAEAVWLEIYGEKIYEEKPYDAILKDDIWTVRGTLPIISLGGTAVIKISKQDGRIIEVYHEK